MLCPTCDHKLKPAARGEVELDCCPACRGAWLKPSELDKLIDQEPDGEERAQARAAPDNGNRKRWLAGIRFYDFG